MSEALVQQAQEYARAYAVSSDEALRRLQLMKPAEDYLHRIEALFPGRYAGGWFANESSSFELHLRFTHGPALLDPAAVGDTLGLPVRVDNSAESPGTGGAHQ